MYWALGYPCSFHTPPRTSKIQSRDVLHMILGYASGNYRISWALGIPISWLVVDLPLWKKIWVRQLGWWDSQYMEKWKICSKPPTNIECVTWWLVPSSNGFVYFCKSFCVRIRQLSMPSKDINNSLLRLNGRTPDRNSLPNVFILKFCNLPTHVSTTWNLIFFPQTWSSWISQTMSLGHSYPFDVR